MQKRALKQAMWKAHGKAVNMIRQRVGLPDLTESDPEKLRELIRKERRIEFAFEEQRFYDVRRWKDRPRDTDHPARSTFCFSYRI